MMTERDEIRVGENTGANMLTPTDILYVPCDPSDTEIDRDAN